MPIEFSTRSGPALLGVVCIATLTLFSPGCSHVQNNKSWCDIAFSQLIFLSHNPLANLRQGVNNSHS